MWTLVAILFLGTPQQVERDVAYRLTWDQCVELGIKQIAQLRLQYPGAPVGARCDRGQAV